MHKTPILYPFLFAIYPVLAFLGHNIELTRLGDALRPLGLALLGGVVLFLLLWILLRDRNYAGFVAAALLSLFYTYGHVYNLVNNWNISGLIIGRHRVLAVLWLLLAILFVWWGNRHRSAIEAITRPMNLIAVLILIIPLGQVILYQVNVRSITSHSAFASTPLPTGPSSQDSATLQTGNTQARPDIYYIILDSYSRDDMLKKYNKLDNTPFLDQLKQLGFFVARCSQSNYSQTELSLASSLNFNYLDQLNNQFKPENTSRAGLTELIQHSALRQELESLGYQTVALDSGFDATRLRDADTYLAPSVSSDLNDFEETFLSTTAYRLISDGVAFLNLPPDWEKRDRVRREHILFELGQMEKIPSLPSPKFVFAHIITPHWPYIFGPNGEQVHERQESDLGYRNQVLFINQRILPIVKNILAQSKTPPIIVIQGDHGAVLDNMQRRMSNLNVYYLPGGGDQLLYDSITPVNTFRVILKHYFGLDLPLLEDVSYYSKYDEPYNYTVVANKRSGCPQ